MSLSPRATQRGPGVPISTPCVLVPAHVIYDI